MEAEIAPVSTVNNSSSRYTQRSVGVKAGKDGRLYLCRKDKDEIGRYLQTTIEELEADPNWRDRLMLAENRDGGLFYKLTESGFLDL